MVTNRKSGSMNRTARLCSTLILVVLCAPAMVPAQELSQEQFDKAVSIAEALAEEALGQSHEIYGVPSAEDRGLILAEGDSWFDYRRFTWRGLRRSDVLKLLEARHGYEVRSVARHGHTLESMTYDVFQVTELAQELQRVAARYPLRRLAILLSAGGNDIAGPELGVLLNHRRSESSFESEQIVSEIFERRLQSALVTFLHTVVRLSEETVLEANALEGVPRPPIPILIHGYDYPVPDGRGWHGGASLLPGPWLEPAFARKGWGDLGDNQGLMKRLIDRYNRVVELVAERFEQVHYVRTVGLLDSSDYEEDWADELHPTLDGFRQIALCFHIVLEELHKGNHQPVYTCTDLVPPS